MSWFVGLLFVLFGGVIIYYSNKIKDWFGVWSFAEQYMGGTQQGYVLLGFVMIVIGFLTLFGVLDLS